MKFLHKGAVYVERTNLCLESPYFFVVTVETHKKRRTTSQLWKIVPFYIVATASLFKFPLSGSLSVNLLAVC